MINTMAYARGLNDAVNKFAVSNAESFAEAIALVRKETGVYRVLCVVESTPTATAAPIPSEVAA